jgi:hypothetical protein
MNLLLKTAMYDNLFKIRKELWNDGIKQKFCQENSTLSFTAVKASSMIIICIFVFPLAYINAALLCVFLNAPMYYLGYTR